MKLNTLFEGFSSRLHKAEFDSSDENNDLSAEELTTAIDIPMDNDKFMRKLIKCLMDNNNYREINGIYKFINNRPGIIKQRQNIIIDRFNSCHLYIRNDYDAEKQTYFHSYAIKYLHPKITLNKPVMCSINSDNIITIDHDGILSKEIPFDGTVDDSIFLSHRKQRVFNFIITNNKNFKLMLNMCQKFLNNRY